MKSYDAMPAGVFVPFAMLSGPMNLRTEVINTDCHGFRWTRQDGHIRTPEHCDELEEVNVLLGGSAAFGVGSSSDGTTVASLLAAKTTRPWLNFGIRGAVSFQEYIHLIRFIHRFHNLRNVVIFSGLNDVYVNLLHKDVSQFDRRFEEQSAHLSLYSWKRQAAAVVFGRLYGAEPDTLVQLPLKQMMLHPLRSKTMDSGIELNVDQQLARLADVVSRNFLLYAALAREIQCRIHFVLQPFFPWTGKTASNDERAVFDALLDRQNGTVWREMLERVGGQGMHERVASIYESAGRKWGLGFTDANRFFDSSDTLFVDSVHLNDAGCGASADLIAKGIQ